MNYEKWLKENTESLKGRCVAITGSTGGLGVHICNFLCFLGADLVLLDRNAERSQKNAEALKGVYKDVNISLVNMDLSDIESVKNACAKLKEMKIDILIHNAGAYSIPRKICSTGLDNVFQINFMSPYYITKQLIECMPDGGRVVAVGSIAHNYSKSDSNDIDFSKRHKSSLVYGNAKRYIMYSLGEEFLSVDNIKLSVVHPGITFTNITAHYPKLIFAVIKHPMKVIFMPPKKAALCIVKGIFENCGYSEWIGPRFFDVWGLPKLKRLSTASSDERKRIFNAAEMLYEKIK